MRSKNEKVFLAGVAEQEGKLVTNGGRVLCVTALGESVFEAQQKALKLAEQIQWSGRFLSSRYWLQGCGTRVAKIIHIIMMN
ncbi:phosphoribosylamine--glycine ligase [Haemophilus influenzae R3021]|uniref:Glycinamide ribonucleotide synthetase n=1 Tax=Haemophilus influenzae R3021 TaxID=375432 RepID=A4N1G3_HAEIF|nr:phosphoribosylamine--glycine ligase [Haemophilus influenzae R3021]